MASRSFDDPTQARRYERGQRLYCRQCGSEIEILSPCGCTPADQEFRCCGEPMQPSTGASVNVNVAQGME
jgi:hypothetical protein